MQHTKDKLSNWLLSSVALPAVLVPLLLVETGSIVQAQGFKAKQLIAQSCRNIDIRPQPRRNITLPKGTLRVTCGYKLRFQSDGNLVLADKSEKALWATGTEGRGERLVMQADGNLVIYDSANKPLWATNTFGNPGAFFAIQGDGNLVIYKADGKALWASGTDGGQARTRSAASEWQQASQPQPSRPNQPSTPPPPNTQASKRKIDAFVNQFNGTRNIQRYDRSDLGGQCVTLIIRYLQDHYGASKTSLALGHGRDVAAGAANQFPGSFFPLNDPSDPKPGSIISFQGFDPRYGHVALIINSNRDGDFLNITILESNADLRAESGDSKVSTRNIRVNARDFSSNYGGRAYWVNPRD